MYDSYFKPRRIENICFGIMIAIGLVAEIVIAHPLVSTCIDHVNQLSAALEVSP